MLHVDDRVAGLAKRVQHPASRRGSGLRRDQRIRAAREVVPLDVDDQQSPRARHVPEATSGETGTAEVPRKGLVRPSLPGYLRPSVTGEGPEGPKDPARRGPERDP